MMRNHVVMAALMVASGHQEKAAQLVADMHASWPDLTLASTRLPALVNKTKRQEFIGLLAKAGL